MKKWMLPIGLFALGLTLLAFGLYVGQTDDSPGAGGLGILSMICLWGLGFRMLRRNRDS